MSNIFEKCVICNGFILHANTDRADRCICNDTKRVTDVSDLYPKSMLMNQKRVEDLVPLIDCIVEFLYHFCWEKDSVNDAYLLKKHYIKAKEKFYAKN